MNIAVIGCGSIGSKYAKWLSEMDENVGVFDNDPARLEALESNARIKAFNSIDEILHKKPSKVIVATPPNYHADIAISAMQSGADVLIEKPVSVNLDDAARIVETSKTLDQSTWVVCNMRFHPGIQMVKNNLLRIGKILFARAHFGHRLSQMRTVGLDIYASNASEGGGVILDCIHEIDYLQWFFGEVSSLRSCMAQLGPDKINAEDYAELQLEYKSGVRVSLHLDFLMRNKRRGLEVIGTEGNLIWNSVGRSPEECSVTFADDSESDVLLDDHDIAPSSSYCRMLESFLSDGNDLQTIAEGYEALKTALEARKE